MSDPEPKPSSRLLARVPFDTTALRTGPVKRYYLATLIGALGTGLTLSLFVVYFVQARHFHVVVATLLLSWESILGLGISPVYGTLVDKYGPSRVLTVAMPVVALGIASIGFASTVPLAFASATAIAMGGAGTWGALTVLLTRIVPEPDRQNAFGVNFMILNLGIGLGGLVGTSLANVQRIASFESLYLASGSLAMAAAVLVFTLRRFGGPSQAPVHHETVREGWHEVVRDTRLLRYLAVTTLLVICGYGSVEAGLPLFVTRIVHLPINRVGLLFFFNTFTIIFAQLFVLGRIQRRSRSLLLGVVGLAWGTSWLLATASVAMGALAAAATLCLGQVIFAFGETMWAPVAPALVNDLAPEHLRGRYNALSGLVWGVSGTIGPLIAGLFLAGGHGTAWTLTIAAGALVGGIGATTLRRVLTPAEDGRDLAAP